MAYCRQPDSNGNNIEATKPRQGKVNEVRQQWAEKEDGCLAYDLQSKEYVDHFGRNRKTRRTVRDDIPVAKLVQGEEEGRRQREKMELLERHKLISDSDAVFAAKVMTDESDKRQRQEHRIVKDRLYAQCVQEQTMDRQQAQDEIAAQNILCAELLHDNQERKRTELDDERMARVLQQKERDKYDRRQRQHELTKERKLLEATQQERTRAAEVAVAGYRREQLGGVHQGVQQMRINEKSDKLLRNDGKLEDVGDFSDFYIQPGRKMLQKEKKQLQELQDEELARLVQDQEHKRGARIDQSTLQQIEQTDGEIARIMQEQEKLKARKRGRRSREDVAPQENHWEQRNRVVRDNTLNERGPGGRDADAPKGRAPPAYPSPPAYYQQRPLPDTPRARLHSGGSGEEELEEAWLEEGSAPDVPPKGNVIASIDPTYAQHAGVARNASDSSLRSGSSPYSGGEPSPRETYGHNGGDDLQNAGRPVQGQRRVPQRSDGKRGGSKKGGSCKQQ